MEQENKKISFGFSRLTKKPSIFQKPATEKKNVQLIDCLEGQTIKIIGEVQKVKKPLVIPMVENLGNVLQRRRELKLKHEVKSENIDERPDSELTVDELAARELIRDAQNADVKKEAKVLTLPAITENTIEIEGKEEPTLEDYENIPINDYGMAMLRGMGWSEGQGIGKNKSSIKVVEPTLRPKGMGLGANKGANKEYAQKPSVDKNGEELILKKGAYARIVDGKQKGNYCEVQGFDDEAGRVIVKTTLQGLILSLNEFLVRPVTKEEYVKCSKVLNNAKYEEYKKSEHTEEKSTKQTAIRKESRSSTKSSKKCTLYSDDSGNERKSYENGIDNKYRKKSKQRHRSSSRSSIESSGNRRNPRDRSKSISVSDQEDNRYERKVKHGSSSNSTRDSSGSRRHRERGKSSNDKHDDTYRKKSKKKYRSSSHSSSELHSNRRQTERSRSPSLSDHEYKKHSKKSKKKSKDKSRYKDSNSSDSDYKRKGHKTSRHKDKHNR